MTTPTKHTLKSLAQQALDFGDLRYDDADESGCSAEAETELLNMLSEVIAERDSLQKQLDEMTANKFNRSWRTNI